MTSQANSFDIGGVSKQKGETRLHREKEILFLAKLGSTPQKFMKEYELRANSKDFDSVASLIDENAIYWFSDGSYAGLAEIRKAFQRTWEIIKDEDYKIHNLKWVSICPHSAVCTYEFSSKSKIDGHSMNFNGRGTNALSRGKDGKWKIIHEHLSRVG